MAIIHQGVQVHTQDPHIIRGRVRGEERGGGIVDGGRVTGGRGWSVAAMYGDLAQVGGPIKVSGRRPFQVWRDDFKQ